MLASLNRQPILTKLHLCYRTNLDQFLIGQSRCIFYCRILTEQTKGSQFSHEQYKSRLNPQLHKSNRILVRRHCTSLRAKHLFSHLCKLQNSVRTFASPPPHTTVDYSSEFIKDDNTATCPETGKWVKDGISEVAVSGDTHDSEDTGQVSHIPVMVKEVLHILQPKNRQIIVDMTFGAGGHAKEILKVAPGVRYFASDRDPLAYSLAQKLSAEYRPGQVTPSLSRFSDISSNLHEHGVEPGSVDAFLFDLGASSMQFDMAERGFALSKDGPLDMRMDGNRDPEYPTAADVINSLDPHDLAHILKKYGEEKKAKEIAHAIVEARYAFGNFTTTKQLADVVSSVFQSGAFRHDKMFRHSHLATKTFQALRIFVNDELNEIHNGLEVAKHYLKHEGRCAVISFHSLEDRIVKRHFHDIDIDEAANLSIHDHFRNANVSYDVETVKGEFLTRSWLPISRKVIEPTEEECFRNPRSRSAKLRAALKQNIEH